MNDNLSTERLSKRWIGALLLLMFVPLTVTAPYVLLEPEQPTSVVAFPEGLSPGPEGYLLVVLDGVGENIMRDASMMPNLVEKMDESAVLSITTGPLTLSATCVREMMTGVPNAPIDGLRNFNMGHPGGADPWLLAADSNQYSVGMIGSYVMGNMYGGHDEIEFINTFEGHADYYEGDQATGDILEQWLASDRHNVIAAHFSGPDKVGHKWGTVSDEYRNKMLDMDQHLASLLRQVPQNWTVVVTADHGMTASGSHGSAEPDTRNVLALVTGPEIITTARAEGEQLDLAAMMLYDLGLDFPSQVNGRVPLGIFDVSPDERAAAEAWNWEAGLLRHLFFHPQDEGAYRLDEINWEGIEAEPVVIRSLDVMISVGVLSLFFILGFRAINRGQPTPIKEQYHLLTLGCVVAASALFHANLSFSAMIPRAIGAAAVVWLVASSLGRTEAIDLGWTKRLYDAKPWLIALAIFSLIFLDLSKGMLLLLVLWVFFWSTSAMTGGAKKHIPSSKTVYLLAVMAAFSFGSLRLWYALLPLFMLLTGVVLNKAFRLRPQGERVALWASWVLVVVSLSYVHRRLLGTHHLLKLVNMTPTSLSSAALLLLIIVLFSVVFGFIHGREERRHFIIGCMVYLTVAMLLSRAEWAWLQWLTLAGLLVMYGLAWGRRHDESSHRFPILYAALALHMMVSWGPWATIASLSVLICLPALVNALIDAKDGRVSLLNHPQAFVALAVFPWVIWILWWTLLGQVNGVQLCYEGICPHPRELDPGAVRVQGGYFGGGEQPATLWMALMVVSPLFAVSVSLMHRMLKAGLDLSPYMLAQGVVVFGCLALYAYTPIYPRLVFSLTWNLFFALVQLFFAASAVWIHRWLNQRPLSGEVAV